MSDEERQRQELVDRLSASALGMGEVMTVYLGDTLGLYRALDASGAMTASELAEATGVFGRYAREWLEQQAAAGILEVEDAAAAPDHRRFRLPAGHREPLLDPDSPYSIAPLCRSFVAVSGAMPDLVTAFRDGMGVGWEAYGRDLIESQGDFNRPWLAASLGSEYLPSIPDVHARLMSDAGARVVDVACGVGWAGIAVARAYPNVTVDGIDPDEMSIDLAARYAQEAGVADRVSFQLKDAADVSVAERYDVAIVVEAIHDMSQPVAVLHAIREMLKPGGTLIVADERVGDAFTAPAGEVDRLFYVYSVLCCLPSAMDDPDSAATGTVMRRSTFERYAKEAGFDAVSVLPIEHDLLRFYRLDRT